MFYEKDGSEICDDECLLAYEKGSVFIIAHRWTENDSECSGASTLRKSKTKTVLAQETDGIGKGVVSMFENEGNSGEGEVHIDSEVDVVKRETSSSRLKSFVDDVVVGESISRRDLLRPHTEGENSKMVIGDIVGESDVCAEIDEERFSSADIDAEMCRTSSKGKRQANETPRGKNKYE